jgi:hypothetical protein
LRDLAAEKKLAFMRSFVGKTVETITLSGFDGTHTECLTDNYLKLKLMGRHAPNRWSQVRAMKSDADALVGELDVWAS